MIYPKPIQSEVGKLFILFTALFVFLVENAAAQASSPMGHSGPLPDPRFRRPTGLNELQNIANMLVAKNGLGIRVIVSADTSALVPVARYTGSPAGHGIIVNPWGAAEYPPNTWAFIIGHELAHGVDARAQQGPGKSFKQVEWIADEIGASYAVRAGFHLEAHLGWIFSRPNRGSENYGSEHDRAQNLFRLFRADQLSVQHFHERYRLPLQVVMWR